MTESVSATMSSLVDHWPLFGLRVISDRVELRYPDDGLVVALAGLAIQGIHDPGWMPFGMPWTDVPDRDQGRLSLQHHWRTRSGWEVEAWHCTMAAFYDGELVGAQSLKALQFPTLRSFETGSWVTRSRQGQGIGREMRSAILHLGFAGLGAQEAVSCGWHDNLASISVSRNLGYLDNGEERMLRRGQADRMLRFRLPREVWERQRRDDIVIEGVEPCLPLFGLADWPKS